MTREVEEFSDAVLRELNIPGDLDPTIAAAIIARVVTEEYISYLETAALGGVAESMAFDLHVASAVGRANRRLLQY